MYKIIQFIASLPTQTTAPRNGGSFFWGYNNNPTKSVCEYWVNEILRKIQKRSDKAV